MEKVKRVFKKEKGYSKLEEMQWLLEEDDGDDGGCARARVVKRSVMKSSAELEKQIEKDKKEAKKKEKKDHIDWKWVAKIREENLREMTRALAVFKKRKELEEKKNSDLRKEIG